MLCEEELQFLAAKASEHGVSHVTVDLRMQFPAAEASEHSVSHVTVDLRSEPQEGEVPGRLG